MDRKVIKFSFIGEKPNFHAKMHDEGYHTPSGAYFSVSESFDPVADGDFIKHNGNRSPLSRQIGYDDIDKNPNGFNQYQVCYTAKILTDKNLAKKRKIGFSRMGEEPNYIDISYMGDGIFQTIQYISRPQDAIPEWLLGEITIHSIEEF